MTSKHTAAPEVPKNVVEFGRELTELARKHNIKSYETKVGLQPSCDIIGFRADIQIHWSSGRHILEDGSIQLTAKVSDSIAFIAVIESATSHIKDKWNVTIYILLPALLAGKDWEYFRSDGYCTSCPLSNAEASAYDTMDELLGAMQVQATKEQLGD